MSPYRVLPVVLLLSFIAAGVARWHDPVIERDPKELRIVYAPATLNIDPRGDRDAASLSQRLRLALWEPLLAIDHTRGEPVGAAAERWEIFDDGRRVVLHLNPEGRWSNGDPVTAADFVRAVRWALETRTSANLFNELRHAREVLAGQGKIDDVGIVELAPLVLQLEFARALPDPIGFIAAASVFPLHESSLAALAGRAGSSLEKMACNGPYRLETRTAAQTRVVKNAHFRDAGQVAFEAIRAVRTEGPSVYRALFAAGLADFTAPLPSMRRIQHAAVHGVAEVCEEPSAEISMLHFNLGRPPLNDVRVRRALSLALDRAQLARRYGAGASAPAWSATLPLEGVESVRTVEEDLAEARRLLAEAGFPEGRGFPVLRVPIITRSGSNPLLYFCADQWRERLGIRVYGVPLPPNEALARAARGDFDLMHYGWTLNPLTVSVATGLVNTTLPPGFNEWDKREAAILVVESLRKSGRERRQATVELERRVMEQMPMMPVISYRRFSLKHKRVGGWQRDIFGAHPFAALRPVAGGPRHE